MAALAVNIPFTPTFIGTNRDVWKEAFVGHLRELRFTHALTVSWNRGVSLAQAKKDLSLLDLRVNRKLLGPRFTTNSAERPLAVFVFEGLGIGGHLHAHSLWRISQRNLLKFSRMFPGERGGVWNCIVHSGSYKLDINDDPNVVAGYALKAQHMCSEADEMIWSRDFLRP